MAKTLRQFKLIATHKIKTAALGNLVACTAFLIRWVGLCQNKITFIFQERCAVLNYRIQLTNCAGKNDIESAPLLKCICLKTVMDTLDAFQPEMMNECIDSIDLLAD